MKPFLVSTDRNISESMSSPLLSSPPLSAPAPSPNASTSPTLALQKPASRRSNASWNQVSLTSVKELLQSIDDSAHPTLVEIMKRHVFVGVVNRHLSLVQYNTQLLLVNHSQLARELFYQQVMKLFGNARSFQLEPALSVQEMAMLGLQGSPSHVDTPEESLREMATEAAGLLLAKAEMLEEYFAIQIRSSEDISAAVGASPDKRMRGNGAEQVAAKHDDKVSKIMLTRLPRLADGHTPFLLHLPDFLLSLAYDVDWSSEKECFHTIAQAISAFYAELPPPLPPKAVDSAVDDDSQTIPATAVVEEDMDSEAVRSSRDSVHWIVENVLYPSFRSHLQPPAKLAKDHYFVQLASTEQLYKIFERC
jgi:DNA mismatch repair protein MLH1